VPKTPHLQEKSGITSTSQSSFLYNVSLVLGGTKLTGGAGSILGTLGSVLTIGVLRNGMNLMQVPAFYVLVVMGVILIAVLFVDARINRGDAGEVKL